MSSEEIKKKIKPILEKYGVAHAVLFGSYARENATNTSDIDIAVEFSDDANTSFLELIGLEQDITDTLHIKADVVTLNSLLPIIRESVNQDMDILL